MKIEYCTLDCFMQIVDKKKIIGFGASQYAKDFILKYPDIACQISFFVDNNYKALGEVISVDGKMWKILAPVLLKQNSYNTDEYILLIFSNSYSQIISQCKKYDKLGEMKCYIYPLMSDKFFGIFQAPRWIEERLTNPVLSMYREMMKINSEMEDVIQETQKVKKILMSEKEKLIIPKINFLVTTKCTLKCKSCIGMIPYLQGEHFDKQFVIRDMKNFFRGIDECTVAEIGGGEPFLYPDLGEVLEYLVNEEKVKYIRIPTNGTITLSDTIIKLLQNRKVSLYISNYGFEAKTNRFLEIMETNKIMYVFCKDMQWIEAGGITKRNKPTLQRMIEYYRCSAGKMCKTIFMGKIYHCARAARIQMIDTSILDDSMILDEEWEDIEMREHIRSFFLKTDCVGCDYCDLAGIDAEKIAAGIQMQ